MNLTREQLQAILDGDTVQLPDDGRIRLDGFDAPEMDHRSTSGLAEEPGAHESRALTDAYLQQPGARIEVERERDIYDRALGRVTRPGAPSLAEEQLSRGLAYASESTPETNAAFYRGVAERRQATSPEQAALNARLDAQWAAARPNAHTVGRTFEGRGVFARAIDRGLDQMGMMVGGTKLLAGEGLEALGLESAGRSLQASGRAQVDENLIDVIANPREVPTLGDADSAGKRLTWALETIGEQGPNLAAMLGAAALTGGTGAVLGRAGAALAGERMAANAASKALLGASKVMNKTVGAVAAGGTLNVGESKLSLDEADPNGDHDLLALATGIAKTGLDVVGLTQIPGVGRWLLPIGARFGLKPREALTAFGQIPAAVARATLTEGGTEGLQELLDEAAAKYKAGTPIDWAQVREAAAAGALVGGAAAAPLGAAEVGLGRLTKKPDDDTPPPVDAGAPPPVDAGAPPPPGGLNRDAARAAGLDVGGETPDVPPTGEIPPEMLQDIEATQTRPRSLIERDIRVVGQRIDEARAEHREPAAADVQRHEALLAELDGRSPPTAEPQSQFEAQVRAVAAGQKPLGFVPTGSELPALPDGLGTIELDSGTVYGPAEALARFEADAARLGDEQALAIALGATRTRAGVAAQAARTGEPVVAVQNKDAEGNVITEVAAVASEAGQQQVPGGTTDVVPVEQAVAERAEAVDAAEYDRQQRRMALEDEARSLEASISLDRAEGREADPQDVWELQRAQVDLNAMDADEARAQPREPIPPIPHPLAGSAQRNKAAKKPHANAPSSTDEGMKAGFDRPEGAPKNAKRSGRDRLFERLLTVPFVRDHMLIRQKGGDTETTAQTNRKNVAEIVNTITAELKQATGLDGAKLGSLLHDIATYADDDVIGSYLDGLRSTAASPIHRIGRAAGVAQGTSVGLPQKGVEERDVRAGTDDGPAGLSMDRDRYGDVDDFENARDRELIEPDYPVDTQPRKLYVEGVAKIAKALARVLGPVDTQELPTVALIRRLTDAAEKAGASDAVMRRIEAMRMRRDELWPPSEFPTTFASPDEMHRDRPVTVTSTQQLTGEQQAYGERLGALFMEHGVLLAMQESAADRPMITPDDVRLLATHPVYRASGTGPAKVVKDFVALRKKLATARGVADMRRLGKNERAALTREAWAAFAEQFTASHPEGQFREGLAAADRNELRRMDRIDATDGVSLDLEGASEAGVSREVNPEQARYERENARAREARGAEPEPFPATDREKARQRAAIENPKNIDEMVDDPELASTSAFDDPETALMIERGELAEDDVAFVRRTARYADSTPLTKDQLDAIAVRIGKKTATLIRVVPFDALPAVVQETAAKQGASAEEIWAAYHDGVMYLVEGRHKTAAQVEEDLFHELYHNWLRGLLGAEAVKALGQWYNRVGRSRGLLEIAAKYNYTEVASVNAGILNRTDMTPAQKFALIAEELIVTVGARQHSTPIRRLYHEALGAVRAWLRSVGLAKLARYTDGDIAYLLRTARNRRQAGGNGTAFALHTQAVDAVRSATRDASAAFKRTHLSKAVSAVARRQFRAAGQELVGAAKATKSYLNNVGQAVIWSRSDLVEQLDEGVAQQFFKRKSSTQKKGAMDRADDEIARLTALRVRLLRAHSPEEIAAAWLATERAAAAGQTREQLARTDPIAGKLQEYFAAANGYIHSADVRGYRANEGIYLPQAHDIGHLTERKDEYVQWLIDNKFSYRDPMTGETRTITPAAAARIAETLTTPHAHARAADIPFTGSLLDRVLTDPRYQALAREAGWLRNDPAAIMQFYTDTVVKEVEFERQFGDWLRTPDEHGEWAVALYPEGSKMLRGHLETTYGIRIDGPETFKQAIARGTRDRVIAEFADESGNEVQYALYQRDAKLRRLKFEALKKYGTDKAAMTAAAARADHIISGWMGQLGADMSPRLRHAQQWVLVAEALTVLAFSAVSSIPEVSAILARAPSLASVRGAVRAVATDPKATAQLLETLGFGWKQVVNVALLDTTGRHGMEGWPRRILEGFFKLNLQHQWTYMTRALGAEIGVAAFREAAEANDAEFFKPFHITPTEVRNWLKTRAAMGGSTAVPLVDQQYRMNPVAAALREFVNERVVIPDPSVRPTYMNNPKFQLIGQLKSFLYAYGPIIIGGMARHAARTHARAAARGDTKTMAAIQAGLPFLLLGAMGIPLAALAGDLKDWLKYDLWGEDAPDWREKEGLERTFELLRRSGALGPFEISASLFDDTSPGFVAVLGPAAGHIDVGLTHGFMSMEFLRRSTPVLNQMPGFWKMVKED